MSDYLGFTPTGPNGETFGAWMIGHKGEGVWLTPILDVEEECDCGECMGTAMIDYRRVAELSRRTPGAA